MEIYVVRSAFAECRSPLLVVGVPEDSAADPPALRALDQALGGAISRLRESKDFRGKKKEMRLFDVTGGPPKPERILLAGLGKSAECTPETIRRVAAEAALEARKRRTGEVAFGLPFGPGVAEEEQARVLVEAARLALYEFQRYRSKPNEDGVPIARLTLVAAGDAEDDDLGRATAFGRIAADCQNFVRDLANTPAGDATPADMADRAAGMAYEFGLSVEIVEREEMARRSMGGILGVGQGSASPPKLVILERNAGRTDLPLVALVGKGVTFDTGGISIKPADGMQDMKFDKAGACAVLGAMRAAAMLDLPLRLVSVTPFVENMPSGSAMRPGDVIRCANGKTIEVLNTDAEGRLILADALVEADRREPAAIVDLATLTGACMVALGPHCAGLMSRDDGLAKSLIRAGEASGERVWRLPLFPEYREQMDSDVADMKNLGPRFGGAITAAAMLSEFVGNRPWAHLDVAGVAWRDSDRDYLRKGATGYGVRLLIEFLKGFGKGESA